MQGAFPPLPRLAPYNLGGLNLPSKRLVHSRDLQLKCLPEPSREQKRVKHAGWKLCRRAGNVARGHGQLTPRGCRGKRAQDNIKDLLMCQEKLKI